MLLKKQIPFSRRGHSDTLGKRLFGLFDPEELAHLVDGLNEIISG